MANWCFIVRTFLRTLRRTISILGFTMEEKDCCNRILGNPRKRPVIAEGSETGALFFLERYNSFAFYFGLHCLYCRSEKRILNTVRTRTHAHARRTRARTHTSAHRCWWWCALAHKNRLHIGCVINSRAQLCIAYAIRQSGKLGLGSLLQVQP